MTTTISILNESRNSRKPHGRALPPHFRAQQQQQLTTASSHVFTLSHGKGKKGAPSDPIKLTGLAALKEWIEKTASLKRFEADVDADTYKRQKDRNAWFMRAIDESAAYDEENKRWHRRRGSVTGVDFLFFDADKMPLTSYDRVFNALQRRGIAFAMYRTPGDGLECKGRREGFRAIVPCLSVSGEVAEAVSAHLRETFFAESTNGGEWDPACDEPTRIIYLPVAGETVETENGEIFDAAEYFTTHGLTLVKKNLHGLERGEADAGAFEAFIDWCLDNVDGAVLVQKPDGRVALQMPGQQPDAYSGGEDSGDGWNFYLPSGDYRMLVFHSLHAVTEPPETFKVQDAVNILAKAYGREPALLYSEAVRDALADGGSSVDSGLLSKADNVKRSVVPELLPQTLEVAESLCPLAAAIGVPMADIYVNGLPFPKGLVKYGVNLNAIDDFFRSAFWHPEKGHAYVMTPIGRLALYRKDDTSRAQQYFDAWFDTKSPRLLDAVGVSKTEDGDAQVKQARVAAWLGEEEAPAPKKRGRPAKKDSDPISAMADAVVTAVCDKLRDVRNQASSLHQRIDMFAASTGLSVDRNGVATLTRPFTPFDGGNRPDQRYVDDYREQFPGVEDLLRWLAACRFASDRKTGFAWIRAMSNAGKGLCFRTLYDMGVVVDMDANDLARTIKGNPAGYTADKFLNAWALIVNECEEINGDFRKLENSLTLNTKNAMATTVDLYAKVFTSADPIKGLVGEHGVEAQFANRFNALALADKDIHDRALFTPATKNAYAAALRYWFADVLNTAAAFYRDLGPIEAARHADIEMARFFDKYALSKTAGRLEDEFDTARERFFAWVRKHASPLHGDRVPLVANNMIKGDGWLFLRSPATVFKEHVRQTYDATDASGLINNAGAILGEVKPDRVPGHGKPRGIWITSPKKDAANSEAA